jgi:hypothetical protein
MPRVLYLHIGMEKTGSTAIQGVLNWEPKALAEQGFYYPETRGEVRHSLLVRAFTPQRNGTAPARSAYLDDFAREITQLPDTVERVIVSAELFSTQVRQAQDVARLRDFLAPLFDRTIVVIYLRRQDAHFASFYSQALRLGHMEPPDMTQLLDSHHIYDYAALLAPWVAAFGEPNMVPRIFERGADRKFDVLHDFAALCGLRLPLGTTDPSRVYNPSISLAGQAALLELGRKMQAQQGRTRLGGPGWRRLTVAMTRVSPGIGWQPTRQQARDFVARFAATNEAVRARWFPDRATLFSEDYDALPEHPPQVDAASVMDAMASAFLRVLDDGRENEQALMVEKALLAKEFGDQKRCRALLEEALRSDPDDPATLGNLAIMQLEAGEWAASRASLDKGLKLAPAFGLLLRWDQRWRTRFEAAERKGAIAAGDLAVLGARIRKVRGGEAADPKPPSLG